MIKNFWQFESFLPFSLSYMYIDYKEYLADALFAQEKLKWKITHEMDREDLPYCVIFCKIRKRDQKRFVQVMEKLANKALLCVGGEYEKYCKEMDAMISEGKAEGCESAVKT